MGGYEQWCFEVAERFCRRGHCIAVLTSRHGVETIVEPEPRWISRRLHLEMEFAFLSNSIQFFVARRARERANTACLRGLIESFAPDVVLVWGMWNLHRSLAAMAERLLPDRVVYYVGDYWPTLPSQHESYWRTDGRHWATRLPKRLLGGAARRMLEREEMATLAFAHTLFPSGFLRAELMRLGVPFKSTKIIYGGVDTSVFPRRVAALDSSYRRPFSLLYAGRLEPEKGVDTAIKALASLVHERQLKSLRLTIAGRGNPRYETYLRDLARHAMVDRLVSFVGQQATCRMPDLYCRADVVLFTSAWQEPFGRVLVEAMAAGAVVVGTATGGAAEIMVDEENALVFTPGNAADLATQVARLIESPSLLERLAEAGRQTATEKFDVSRMTDEIEAYLSTIVA